MTEVAPTRPAEIVRAAEPDRYLATLFAPEDKRADLFALAAFDVELASIRDRVKEALPGEVRLQWWRDTISAGIPTGSPLADALLDTIRRFALPTSAFETYIEGRIFDLYDDPMPDRTALEAYCGETCSTLLQLQCLILSPSDAAAATDASGHAGCAEAITRLIWNLPKHRARGQCYVPAELLSAAGTDVEGFLSAPAESNATRAIEMMIALAREHLAAFEKAATSLPAALRPVYLPTAMCRPRLDAAERLGAAVLDRNPHLSPLRRHWTIWRRAAQGWA